MRIFRCYPLVGILCISAQNKISILLISMPIFVPFVGSCLMHKAITVRVHCDISHKSCVMSQPLAFCALT
jgi:hypothetical protein